MLMQDCVADLEDEEASKDEDANVQERLYDCCICYESTPSTQDRLVGLVVLLQPTSGMSATALYSRYTDSCEYCIDVFQCWVTDSGARSRLLFPSVMICLSLSPSTVPLMLKLCCRLCSTTMER